MPTLNYNIIRWWKCHYVSHVIMRWQLKTFEYLTNYKHPSEKTKKMSITRFRLLTIYGLYDDEIWRHYIYFLRKRKLVKKFQLHFRGTSCGINPWICEWFFIYNKLFNGIEIFKLSKNSIFRKKKGVMWMSSILQKF